MSIELIIAPPAGGKTQACLRRIQALLAAEPFAAVRVVLPDRLQAAYFRRRLALDGGALGVQVGSFGDLYRELLDLAGQPIPLASPALLHRMIKIALEQVASAGGLQHYASLRQAVGFALTLRDTFAELKRALIYPEDFSGRSASPSASPAQQDLARLYQAYQDLLHIHQWADPEGLSWLAVEALQARPSLANSLSLLVVDGFDSFTNAQRRTLELFEKTAVEILVTLPGEMPFRRAAHRRFGAAYQSLQENLKLQPHPLTRRSSLSPRLQQMEANLFETNPRRQPADETICLLEARSPAEEAREALRWIKARVRRDNLSLLACAVVTPDPARYHPFLRQAAAEFNLPLRFTQPDPLTKAPAVAALLNLLSLPARNYPRRLLLDAVRSPYFKHELKSQDANDLDEISRAGQILEGREQWDEVFERLSSTVAQGKNAEQDSEQDPEQRPPRLPHGQQAEALHQRLANFLNRLAPPAGQQTLTDWVFWLESLLEHWQFFPDPSADPGRQMAGNDDPIDPNSRSAQAALDQAVFDQLRQVLHALVLGEAVTGPQRLDYAQFSAELQGALEGAGFHEPQDPTQGYTALTVMRMLEARGVRYQAVAVLGLSEGIFPAQERADPFLDENLRTNLGLESRLQREQPGLFYQAVTRSDKHLLLTRPYLADDGERWEPSPYWKAVLALLPENSVRAIRPDMPRDLNDAASLEEALFWGVRSGQTPAIPDEAIRSSLAERWQHLQHAAEVLRARLAEQPAGPYEGIAGPLADSLQRSYGPEHIWSASRLEAYGACPYQFFSGQALGLEAKTTPEAGMDPSQRGTLLHSILEKAYAAAANPADPESVLAVLPEAARQVFETAPAEQGFRPSSLWEVEQQQLERLLSENIQKLAEADARRGWQPAAYELAFGRSGQGAGPLRISLEEGEEILLHGVIDRVDRSPAGELRIIDYKTGGSHLSKPDLIHGRRLQLPLYALAAEAAFAPASVVEGLYWILNQSQAAGLKLSTFEDDGLSGPEAALDIVRSHLSRIVQGIRQAQFSPKPPKGGCAAYCPAAAWCWRYHA